MALPQTTPERAGLDPKRLAVADAHVREGIAQGVYPAAVLLVARHDRVAHLKAFGTLADGAPVKPDSIFDLASVTKPHVAVGLLTLVEDGKVSLTQSVDDFFPEAKGTPLAPLTLRQLATHSSGLPAWKALYRVKTGKADILAEIFRTAIAAPPGTKYTYSDLGYILIGEVVERVSGMPLDQYLHARLFAPLGMNETGYLPAATWRDRIAPTANEPSRPGEPIQGKVHDGNAFALGGVAGHAGLFGTAPDLAIMAQALATDGRAGDRRVLGLPTLRLVRQSQIPAEVGGHSIGWFAPPNGMLPRGDILDDATFGHTGFTGTLVVNNPPLGLSVILLTNRVMNPNDTGGGISRVRRRVLNAVASAIIS
jgi:CubicO group peptidase (beta-lactamase class C family)